MKIAGYISLPLMRLKEIVSKFGKGEFEAKADIESSDEIGQLASSFKKMGSDIVDYQQKLIKSRSRFFKTVLNSLSEAVSIIDVKDYRILEVNTEFFRQVNLSRDEVIGRSCHEIICNRTEPCQDLCLLGKVVETGKPSTVEHVNVTGDGRQIYAEVTASPIKNKKGEVIQIVCSSRDITEKRRMEEVLKENEEYFRSFIESSQDSVCNLSTGGVVLNINPAGLEINDYPDYSCAVGRDFTSSIIENREEAEEAVRLAAEGNNTSALYKSVTPKRKEIWWDARFTPIKDIDNSIKSILQVSRDVTEGKELEDALHYVQRMLFKEHDRLDSLLRDVDISNRERQKIMDSVADLIILTDTEGRIKRVNEAVMKLTGKSIENIRGKEWESLMHESELAVSRVKAKSVEVVHKPTGKWFTLQSYPFKDDTNFLGNVITLHETTETRKGAEKLESKNRELQNAYEELKATHSQMLQGEKMASIGQLAAGVAHEINNPMGFISSNMGSLRTYVKKIMDFVNAQSEATSDLGAPEVEEKLSALRKKLKLDFIVGDIGQLIEESLEGAERVKKIVQNLKSFSRIDETEYKPADINECMESTLNIVWNELKYKATVNKEYGELPLTRCYPQQLNQVFMNLLVNAAQAIEKEGEIAIRTWNGNDYINVSISDTGEGIPGDKLNRIFEPFYTTKPVGKGTGLGLSITYDIIKKHNGELTVESEVGKGTTFNIKIPVVEGKENG